MSAPGKPAPAEVRRHFEELVELEPEARARALAALGAESAELAVAVGELLAADAAAAGFLEQPAGVVAKTLVADWLAEETEGRAGALVGPYRLFALLGRGGMGEVWEAERVDGHFEQRVALKLLRAGAEGEEVVARFLRERQILARLTHPGIARLLDGGRSGGGRPYLVLERVVGLPIDEHCRTSGASLAERIRLVVDACDAVESAHRQLVVHRDLKPSNVLVTADGRVQLLDFGIAKLLDESVVDAAVTRLGAVALTPAYAAPEQILGEPVTTASDVYALGVILHELLLGVLPHRREGRSAARLVAEITRETLQRPSTAARQLAALDERARRRLERALRGDLDTILLKALAREPERRYLSAAAFGDDLRRFLAARPVAARPDSVAYRLRKFVRRHRAGAAAALLVLLSLLGGLGAALWQAGRAEAKAREATANARRAERTKEFLISLFRIADPMESGGETVSARSLLEQGAKRLEGELANEPELRSDLLDAVARIEKSLGLFDQAARAAELALDLRRSGDAATRAPIEATLGAVRIQQGELDAAQELLERAVATLEATGAEPLALARAESDLGEVFFWRKRVAEAEATERKVYEIYRREMGEDHVETALHLRNIGVILDDLGRLDEAENAYRRSQEVLERRLGAEHPQLGQSYLSLAVLLDRRQAHSEADALYRHALALRRAAFGDRHLVTAQTLQLFANSLTGRGELDEAERLTREALEIFRAINPQHFEVGKCWNGLGVIAAKRGDAAAAERAYREALANYRRSLGPDHVFVWWTQGNLARAMALAQRFDEAESLAREALGELVRITGTESDDVRWVHEILAEVLRGAGRAGEADAEAARAAEIAKRLADREPSPPI